ncbi:hypothetical protein [Pseudoxanthomonas sp. SGNA-20]|uniref:hypothetical protein n=1 Tax=Pseudoxanthomonas sp. SGNA-20 TaxID=2493088 RepID=UPI001319BA20|nr:hypothetical protein [Pseudoxanthomonas sp. SGNA-20]
MLPSSQDHVALAVAVEQERDRRLEQRAAHEAQFPVEMAHGFHGRLLSGGEAGDQLLRVHGGVGPAALFRGV